jgi:hypothetical protein
MESVACVSPVWPLTRVAVMMKFGPALTKLAFRRLVT